MAASDVPPPRRSETREIVELRRLRENQPELASAVDLQIALLELQRRIKGRVPLPWVEVDAAWLKRQQEAGRPLLDFKDIPLNWSDFRLVFRETAELLRRYDALDPDDYSSIQALARDGNVLEPLVARWYDATARPPDEAAGARTPLTDLPDMLDQVLVLATRPFLARCAEVIMPKLDLAGWSKGTCPLCGGEPELAVIMPSAERLLICGRCTARWRFAPLTCPFCDNADRSRITSFASRDGTYRIYACDVCKRYLKAYDSRRSDRPVMPPVDLIATLPLDAAAMQKGYTA